jgi:hypothetical protein
VIFYFGNLNPLKTDFPPWKKFGLSTIAGEGMLNQDFKEFIQLLNDNQVHYLVVGGYAVALHGYPRYTKDNDIWIELAQENSFHTKRKTNYGTIHYHRPMGAGCK